jgi:predicted nuclease with TOPRIM domain
MNPELSEKFKGVQETLADIKQECVMMEAKLNSKDKTISSLEGTVKDLKENNYSEDDFLPIKNTQDELKREVCARLFKNLTLEQLENLEVIPKEAFKYDKKEYILEIP